MKDRRELEAAWLVLPTSGVGVTVHAGIVPSGFFETQQRLLTPILPVWPLGLLASSLYCI